MKEKQTKVEITPMDHYETSVLMVKSMDEKAKRGEDTTEDKKKVIKMNNFVNTLFWPGYTNIRNARQVYLAAAEAAKLDALAEAERRHVEAARRAQRQEKKALKKANKKPVFQVTK